MMKKGPYTMQDIADRLGISKSTVSRALKNHPDISTETKKAVMALAKELDFEPNSLALSLRQNKSFIIGIIVPEIVHDFFANVISGVQAVAYEAGYNVMICISNERYEQELKDTRALLASRVDGLLLSITRETQDFAHIEKIQSKGVPLVFFDRAPDSIQASRVVTDDFDGAFKATEHLIQQGCRHIAHLAGPNNLQLSQKRLGGYLSALAKYDIPKREELILDCSHGSIEEGEEITLELLDSGLPVDAIFGNNDMAAIGAIKAIRKRGLRVPEDIAVVGFSDWKLASLVDPPLTSVAQSGFEIGKAATELLLEEIRLPKDVSPRLTAQVVPSELVVRESSQKL